MSETTYYQKENKAEKQISNRGKDYCISNKEVVLREKLRTKYRKLSEEDKNIKREYGRKRYKNMSKEEKDKLKSLKISKKLS